MKYRDRATISIPISVRLSVVSRCCARRREGSGSWSFPASVRRGSDDGWRAGGDRGDRSRKPARRVGRGFVCSAPVRARRRPRCNHRVSRRCRSVGNRQAGAHPGAATLRLTRRCVARKDGEAGWTAAPVQSAPGLRCAGASGVQPQSALEHAGRPKGRPAACRSRSRIPVVTRQTSPSIATLT
jgi:hypothetical protein